MKRKPPRLATALLNRLSNNDGLAGDLREAYAKGKSARWYWGQVITAMWFSTDRIVARRSIWFSVATISAAVVILELPFLHFLVGSATVSRGLLMALYLMPQAIPIAVPVGIVIGTFCGLEERVFPRRMSPPLLIAVLSCCVASFAISGWIVPASNQAFRVTVAGRHVLRGAPELTLTELRSALVDNLRSTRENSGPPFEMSGTDFLPSNRWEVAVNYYGRLAVSFAPLVFAMFALSAASLLPRRRLPLVVGAGCAYLGYFLHVPEWFMSLPPMAVAWMPNVALAMMSLLIAAWISSRRVRVNIE